MSQQKAAGQRQQKANKRDRMIADRREAKIRWADRAGVDVDDLGAEEELHSSDWSGSECGMLDEKGNPWPQGQQISFDDGMGGYIPYNVDQIHTLPQLATPAGPMTEESARAHEKFLSTKSPAHDRAVAADAEKERRQAEKAAKEQRDQNRAAAYSQEMRQRGHDRTSANWWSGGGSRQSMLPPKH